MSASCALICVGSELLRGKINTHASTLACRLPSVGLSLDHEETVGDELSDLTLAIRRGLNRFDVVIVTGGLGPTFDDLTREAAAAAAGRPLIFSKALLKEIAAKFRRARYKMPPANERQAYLLEGAEPIANVNGTAPGQLLLLPPWWGKAGMGGLPPTSVLPHKGGGNQKVLILLPGPPREMHPMLEKAILPALKKIFPSRPRTEAHLHFVGIGESRVDHGIRPLIEKIQKSAKVDVSFTILAHLGLVDFDIFVSAGHLSEARGAVNRMAGAVRRLFPEEFYGMDADYPLEKVAGDLLRRKNATLAVAESCTGGKLSGKLTDIVGSSDYLRESVVTYSNEAKVRDLGVPAGLLKKFGAVSKPVAIAMAQGVRRRARSTYGLSITGIAGPGGGTPSKPVGLVHMAMAGPKQTIAREFHFTGDRDAVRQRAVTAALDLLRQTLKNSL